MDYKIFAAKAFSAVTGISTEAGELWEEHGDRIWNLKRAVMVKREGRVRADDTLSDAVFDTVWPDHHPGTQEELETQFDREEFEALKDRYYALCGWDNMNGRPTGETLVSLDMADVADVLEGEGLLGKN
jgi:aldehyde:ferredoxin oxidoreductase